jgi:hypothetical protein
MSKERIDERPKSAERRIVDVADGLFVFSLMNSGPSVPVPVTVAEVESETVAPGQPWFLTAGKYPARSH